MKTALARAIATQVARHPWRMFSLLLLVAVASMLVITKKGAFDTEVLNMLPPGFDSVKGLQFYNKEFSQSRQLSFGIIGKPDSEDFDDFVDHFDAELHKQPWVLRVLHGSPLESEKTVEDLHELMLPLLLSSNQETFAARMESLKPEAIQARIKDLRKQLDTGSIRAELELSVDPLGVLLPSIRPMLETARALGRNGGANEGDQRFELFLVSTKQEDLGEQGCIKLITEVKAFRDRMLSEWKGTPPEVVLTGRAAYIAEISKSMQRDIFVTSIVSVVAVGLLFFIGFRRILPLVGILGLLALSCLAGLAAGVLVFGSLNVVAIAFCSILVGLGDDFSLLLLERYRRCVEEEGGDHMEGVYVAIRDAGPGILAVALITALSFLSLTLSGSRGFAHLGGMIAAGVLLCGVFMILFLFLFVRKPSQTVITGSGSVFRRYIRAIHQTPKRFLLGSAAAFLALGFVSLHPNWPLRFDTEARSLEPKQSEASVALAKITAAMKFQIDPVIVKVDGASLQETHDRWHKLGAHLDDLVKRGEIKSFSNPAPFLFSPSDATRNVLSIKRDDIIAGKAAFLKVLEEEGLDPQAFQPSLKLLDLLADSSAANTPQGSWRPKLREESPLWFLVDRYLAAKPFTAVGYVYPIAKLDAPGVRDRMTEQIKASGVPLLLSGWNYTLLDLVPWARAELSLFATAVVGLIALLLGIYYRRWDLWLIHMAALAFSAAGLIATMKLFGRPVNLLNVLAFPLFIAIGVDYGLHVLAAAKEEGDWVGHLDSALKPIIMSGITTVCGFGSLCLAQNPALAGLGEICALGILWSLIAVVAFAVPCLFACTAKAGGKRGTESETPLFADAETHGKGRV